MASRHSTELAKGLAEAHARKGDWITYSALPFVRGVYGRVLMWRRPAASRAAAKACERSAEPSSVTTRSN